MTQPTYVHLFCLNLFAFSDRRRPRPPPRRPRPSGPKARLWACGCILEPSKSTTNSQRFWWSLMSSVHATTSSIKQMSKNAFISLHRHAKAWLTTQDFCRTLAVAHQLNKQALKHACLQFACWDKHGEVSQAHQHAEQFPGANAQHPDQGPG
jgi:hypothetical protein